MRICTLERWQHSHDFAIGHDHAEKSTTKVMILPATMQEIAARRFTPLHVLIEVNPYHSKPCIMLRG